MPPRDVEANDLIGDGDRLDDGPSDDPLGRGFEYVPTTGPIQFAPLNELFV